MHFGQTSRGYPLKNPTLDTSAVQRPGAFFGHITQTVRTLAAHCYATHPSGRTLDVGCGNGLFFASLPPENDQRIGVDLDLQLLQEARRIFIDNHLTEADWVRGEITALPFQTQTFDNIFFLNTLINIPTDEMVRQLLGELMRICRPNGRIFLDIRNAANPLLRFRYWQHNRREDFTTRAYHMRQLSGLFATKGFCITRKIPIGPRLPFLSLGYVIEVTAPQS